MKLYKPIVFFDLETTGVDPVHDRIVEISLLKIYPNEMHEDMTYRLNPEIPIPKEATAIHGITDDDIARAPVFKQIAKDILNFIEDSDIGGYNSNKFDIPLLAEEFLRAGIFFDFKKRRFVDVMVIFMKKEPRNLEAAYRFYCNKELSDAHSACADIRATYEVFKAQLERYEDLGNSSLDTIAEYSSYNRNVDLAGRLILDENDDVIVNFGKYKGRKLVDVFRQDTAYYDWVQKHDFPLYTKHIFTREYLKFKCG